MEHDEIWKDVLGYEGIYQVSNLGRVKSLERKVERADGVVYTVREKMLAPTMSTDGYSACKLCFRGSYTTVRIHRLVANAFIPNPLGLEEVNHIDFDRRNNSVDNLEWVSHKQNIHHTILAGRHYCNRDLRGENNPNYGNSKLKAIYSEHPEYAKRLLSRPGAKNGRAHGVNIIGENGDIVFSGTWVGECCEYLRNNGFTSGSDNTIRTNIWSAISTNGKYLGFTYSKQ